MDFIVYPAKVSGIWLQFDTAYNFSLTKLNVSHFKYYTLCLSFLLCHLWTINQSE